jgi:superfamily II DNA or RNA helicase
VALAVHQEKAVSAGYGEGRGIIDHCVGAGKSWVLAELVRRCGVPALVLVHTKELLRQNFEVLREVLDIPNLIGWIGDGQWEPNWITVATYQSINAAMRHYPKDVKRFMAQVQNVLVDECQHAVAPTYESVLKMATEAYYHFGLSATPFRSDDDETFLKVTAWTGPVLSRVGPKEGVEVGRLVPADIYMVDYGAQDNGLPWPRQYEVGVVEHYERNRIISEIVKAAPKPVLVLIERIEHGRRLFHELMPSGLRASYITGMNKSEVRARALEHFRDGAVDVLVSSVILDEGVNLPDIRTLVLAGGGKAKHRLIQRVGRGQRKTEGKSSLIVFDFQDKGKYLGAHARRRAKTYEREPAYTLYRIGAKEVLEVLRG